MFRGVFDSLREEGSGQFKILCNRKVLDLLRRLGCVCAWFSKVKNFG
jgi:hypothetical protein